MSCKAVDILSKGGDVWLKSPDIIKRASGLESGCDCMDDVTCCGCVSGGGVQFVLALLEGKKDED